MGLGAGEEVWVDRGGEADLVTGLIRGEGISLGGRGKAAGGMGRRRASPSVWCVRRERGSRRRVGRVHGLGNDGPWAVRDDPGGAAWRRCRAPRRPRGVLQNRRPLRRRLRSRRRRRRGWRMLLGVWEGRELVCRRGGGGGSSSCSPWGWGIGEKESDLCDAVVDLDRSMPRPT